MIRTLPAITPNRPSLHVRANRPFQLAAAVFAVASVPLGAWGHDGRPIGPQDVLTAWNLDPWLLMLLGGSAVLYSHGLRRVWRGRPGRGIRVWEARAFTAGWLVLTIALLSPIDPLGATLFSAHMIQHVLLMSVAAPLLVLGRPIVPAIWALPATWRHPIAFTSTRVASPIWRWLTIPFIAWSVHALVLWTWHLPPLYQAGLASDRVHAVQHASFLAGAVLFWWALLRPRAGAARSGLAVIGLFTTALHAGGLAALFVFAPAPFYPAYEGLQVDWGISALEDQQLAGVVMWVPGGIPYVLAGLAALARWLAESDRRTLRWEARISRLEPQPWVGSDATTDA